MEDNQYPLWLALDNSTDEMAAFLIQRGATVSDKNRHNAIMRACGTALALMLKGKGIKAKNNMLFVAASSVNPALVGTVLLEAGADPNAVLAEDYHDCSGPKGACEFKDSRLTALGYACAHIAFGLAHLLLDHGADPARDQAVCGTRVFSSARGLVRQPS